MAIIPRQSLLLGMLAETFVHVGDGQSNSVIDLPVARERFTNYPFIPGSGVKGAFKSWAEEQAGFDEIERNLMFGVVDGAGTLLFTDARLLLRPVRSLNAAYIWLTCPYILERLSRDVQCAGRTPWPNNLENILDGKYHGPEHTPLVLEEREFSHLGAVPVQILAGLSLLLPSGPRERLEEQLAIVSNTDFRWFATYGLQISAHNKLTKKKTSENLWYEETLPPETLMYCRIIERSAGTLNAIKNKIIGTNRYCQFGGNETVGQGWFQLTQPEFAPTTAQQAGGALA